MREAKVKKLVREGIECFEKYTLQHIVNCAIEKHFKDNIATCETCGCLVEKNKAFLGKEVIAKRWAHLRYPHPPYEESYIHKPYYCKKCKPKEKKKEEKQ